ncbi:unnamed protein product [Schistosoma margrebowiei]|uniref:Uncharacterized protein n=1 Tax=Schistosoma margrebowiei TaxID=48269 RepID=A0A183LPJ2_9TREM|nr:unnamed protein product [Schistosoma margrebowiei]VDO67475.1 unnamed protein product [Schistosoma margrebowiei]
MCCCEYEIIKYIIIYFITIMMVIYLVSGEDYLLTNEDISKLTETTRQTTIDPILLESYRKTTIKSFIIFGVIFGLINVACWIVSIIKAIIDRRKIKKRNLARQDAKRFKTESHRKSVLKDLINPEPPTLILPNIVDNAVKIHKNISPTTSNPSDSPIHHFSRCSTLRRSDSLKRSTQSEIDEPTEKDLFVK